MNRLRVLGEQGVKRVHEATLRLLAETGIVLTHPGARELLLAHGARATEDRVLFPADLVESSVAQCSPMVRLEGRDPEMAIKLDRSSWYAHNVGGVPNVLEAGNRTRRPAGRADVVRAARLLDALPNVSSVTPHFTPQDVPPALMTLWMYYDTVLNTTKPIRAPGVQTAREVRALVEMARIACPGTTLAVGISPISPLTFPDEIAGAMLEAASQGMILGPLPCPILGATAPMSIAGGLVQQNAEVLASIVLAQLARPGLPILYKGRLSVMDPRTGLSVWGNPEIGLVSAATTEMGHHYGLPVDVYGLSTSAHTSDIQNGYERAFNALVPVLAGADEISGVGEIDSGVNSSLAQMVMDDEILSSVGRIWRGFEVDEEALALDVMAEVMSGPRNFLAEMHTVRYLRRGEVLQTRLAGRDSWAEWEVSGRRGLVERAQEKALKLLADHEVPPPGEEQVAALREVIRAFV
ncbi:MAG: trimethylamine methyltransferase family protein [Anaerolineae bacterium]|nr:MAG: trimethylamine methyltransferase family protein [Anaerolineae bacterium]